VLVGKAVLTWSVPCLTSPGVLTPSAIGKTGTKRKLNALLPIIPSLTTKPQGEPLLEPTGECVWFSGVEAAEPANFAPNSRVAARDDWWTDGHALAENGGHSDNFCSAWYLWFIKLVRRGVWNKGARSKATDEAESWNRESNISTGPLLSTRQQV